jgi:fructoselysine-6-P-deglycase FrlB-like protein
MRFNDGVQAQPEVLVRSAAAVQAALEGVDALRSDQLVALVGIGASEHIARSAASAWRAAGIRAVALSASELLTEGAPVADVYVALSESGRSAETVGALERIKARRVGITNGPDSPLTEVVDDLVLLDSGPDSPVYTTGYTATLQAVGMLGEHWLGQAGDWSAVPEQVAAVLAHSAPVVDELARPFGEARIVDVVGSGTSTATAGEGALVLREAARAHTAAHETYNYLHGPMEPLDSQTACIIVGDGRELRLASEVSGLGCRTLLITSRPDVGPADHLAVLTLPPTGSPLATAILEILPLQTLAWRLASDRGLRVDGFRYEQDDTKLESR